MRMCVRKSRVMRLKERPGKCVAMSAMARVPEHEVNVRPLPADLS